MFYSFRCLCSQFSCILGSSLFSKMYRMNTLHHVYMSHTTQIDGSNPNSFPQKAGVLSTRSGRRSDLHGRLFFDNKEGSVGSFCYSTYKFDRTRCFETSHNCRHQERFQMFITTAFGAISTNFVVKTDLQNFGSICGFLRKSFWRHDMENTQPHLNYVTGYTGPFLFLFERTHNYYVDNQGLVPW